jgi:hypothetical protein
MARYLVILHARNFSIDVEGCVEPRNAFTAAIVRADDAADAGTVALTAARMRLERIAADASQAVVEVIRVERPSFFRRESEYGLAFYDPDDRESQEDALSALLTATGLRR